MKVKFDKEAFIARLNKLLEVQFENNQTKMSKKIGMAQSTISDMINLKKRPGLESLMAIAKGSGVSIDYLVGLAYSEIEIISITDMGDYEVLVGKNEVIFLPFIIATAIIIIIN